MTRDAQLVLALLRTLLDWHPGPSTWRKNPLNHRDDSGEAPSTTTTCQTCGGHGRRGKTICRPCKGTGQITVDAYTRREVGTLTQHVTRVHLVRCDSCGGDGAHGNGRRCHHCDGTGTRTAAEQLDTLPYMLRLVAAPAPELEDERKLRHHRTGSYTQLETALHRLEREQPVAHSLLVLLVVYDSPAIVSQRVQTVLDSACELLAHWMPRPIRVPEGARRELTQPKGPGANSHQLEQRNQRIRRLRDQGWKTSRIARELGLSERQIKRIS